MKVIIAGGRDFNDYIMLKSVCDAMLSDITEIEIVSGTANGADALGERYANENGYIIHKFPANWQQFGKGAGYIRNGQMAKFSDILIVFWDGKSKGTKHMIDLALQENLKVKIINY